ncbi:MAG: hypothetical protein QNJ17_05565 [Desulfocapsaceae bacterium]|nr:hypothetical protein [Desulfocapsaceae bacterium]
MHDLQIAPDQIGFDFDGVIADIGEAFRRLAGDEHNYLVNLDEITSFQVETCTHIPEAIVAKIFNDILKDSLTTRLLPIPGSLEVLSELSKVSRVKIITARSHDQPVIDWLDNYLPAEVCRRIDLVAMHDHDQKVRFIKEHDLTFFVDDRAETCAQVAQANLHPLLYRQPWNSNWHDFTVVDNWQQIAEFIKRRETI